MKSPNSKYDLEKHYLGEEKDRLINGDPDEAYLYAGMRHTAGAVRTARRRFIKDQKYDFDSTPSCLYDLCLRLGIITNTKTEGITKSKNRKKLISEDIFSFLCSLPGASYMNESMWLETPELWCFVNPETIYMSYTRSGLDIREEIRKNNEKWCDKWVCYGSVPEETRIKISGKYIIPYSGLKRIKEYNGKKREDAMNSTYFPVSIVQYDEYKFTGNRKKKNMLKEKLKALPIGYVSFKHNIPVSYLLLLRGDEKTSAIHD